MKHRIAVEEGLTPVADFLSDKGYDVETVDLSKEYTRQMDRYDAVVVTGMNSNFLGVNDVNTKAFVIDASGMTPEHVYHEISQRFN